MSSNMYFSPSENVSSIAVFIDGDNILPSFSPKILEILKKEGNCDVVNLYADFSLASNSEWKHFSQSTMNCVQVWTPTARCKNSTDFKMTIDIVKCSFEYPQIDTIAIVSGDGDFIPVGNEMRRLGKRLFCLLYTSPSPRD